MIKTSNQAAMGHAAEYSVYIYHRAPDGPYAQDGKADWERKITTKNKLRAFAKAKKLYASNDYNRVEIKQKMLTTASAYPLDTTLKIYKKTAWTFKPNRFAILFAGFVLGAIVSAGCLYWASSALF